MKRSSFLKSILGIAIAPMAIAKAIEQCDVKPGLTNKGYGLKVAKSIWYEYELSETEKKFNESYSKMLLFKDRKIEVQRDSLKHKLLSKHRNESLSSLDKKLFT